MASILDRIPAFALPFVTRSLRGGRGKRFAALSLGLALLTLLFGVWVGLGRGDVARDARVTIGIEQPIYVREQQEFVIIRTNPDTLPGELLNRQEQARQRGAMLIVEAARAVGPVREENTQLYADVLAFLEKAGRNPGTADAQIAATARARGMSLATRNTKHFEGLGLDLIDPWSG